MHCLAALCVPIVRKQPDCTTADMEIYLQQQLRYAESSSGTTQGQVKMTYDFVTFGETMIRLTPPNFQRLEMASAFEAHVGGSESNTAVGIARLGMRSAWVSRLTDNPLGRIISGTLAHWGVDTSHIVWTQADRVGTYYYEPERSPRPAQVIYDRAGSAFARMIPDDVPVALFQPGNARLLHMTGITIAAGVSAAAGRVLKLAQAAGWAFSFDVNHRARMIDTNTAREAYQPFAEAANVLFISENDARLVYNFAGQPNEILRSLRDRFPQPAVIVLTRGAAGAVALTADGKTLPQSAFPADGVDRLGRGDAFSAGFLYGYLSGYDTGLCLRWGAALAAAKFTIPGDLPLVDAGQMQALVAGAPTRSFR
ncbi:MAG: sugar kinase [Phototrophicales bacterium]|nr:MAG: sugar kinase [Phototrophicales bacterium]